MEDYGNQVINLQANLFQNIGKFTSKTNQNISKQPRRTHLLANTSRVVRCSKVIDRVSRPCREECDSSGAALLPSPHPHEPLPTV